MGGINVVLMVFYEGVVYVCALLATACLYHRSSYGIRSNGMGGAGGGWHNQRTHNRGVTPPLAPPPPPCVFIFCIFLFLLLLHTTPVCLLMFSPGFLSTLRGVLAPRPVRRILSSPVFCGVAGEEEIRVFLDFARRSCACITLSLFLLLSRMCAGRVLWLCFSQGTLTMAVPMTSTNLTVSAPWARANRRLPGPASSSGDAHKDMDGAGGEAAAKNTVFMRYSQKSSI